MLSLSNRASRVLVSLAICTVSGAAAAQKVTVTIQQNIKIPYDHYHNFQQTVTQTGKKENLSNGNAIHAKNSIVTATGTANAKRISVFANTQIADPDTTGFGVGGSSRVVGTVEDTFTVNAPGAVGKGTMTVLIKATGSTGAAIWETLPGHYWDTEANANWDFGLYTSRASDRANSFAVTASGHRATWAGNLTGVESNSGGTFSVTIPFEYNVGYSLLIRAAAGASVQNVIGYATGDFGHTFEWLGVTAVRDAAGNLVTGASVTGQNGTNWMTGIGSASAAPGPGALVAFGLGLVNLRRRSRRA